jgi:hypothetical protein
MHDALDKVVGEELNDQRSGFLCADLVEVVTNLRQPSVTFEDERYSYLRKGKKMEEMCPRAG